MLDFGIRWSPKNSRQRRLPKDNRNKNWKIKTAHFAVTPWTRQMQSKWTLANTGAANIAPKLASIRKGNFILAHFAIKLGHPRWLKRVTLNDVSDNSQACHQWIFSGAHFLSSTSTWRGHFIRPNAFLFIIFFVFWMLYNNKMHFYKFPLCVFIDFDTTTIVGLFYVVFIFCCVNK